MTDSLALAPAERVIDELMARAIDLQGRRWIGVDPERDPGHGEIAVFIVDAHRMAEQGCDDTLSSSCRTGRLTLDSCAAIDDSAIACDARFLAMLENFALDVVSPHSILRSARFAASGVLPELDRFYEKTYRADLGEQLAQLRSEIGAAVTDHKLLTVQLSAALEMILTHEVAHIVLGHVHDRMTVLRPSGGPGSEEAQESAADDLAIRQIVRRHDPQYIADALFTLVHVTNYAGWLMRRTLGLPLSGSAAEMLADFARRPIDERRVSPAIASVCRSTHGDPAMRIARMARIPEVARALSSLPLELMQQGEELAKLRASICSDHDSATREIDAVRDTPFAVTVRDAGKLPRQRVRYHFTTGSEQVLRTRATTTTTFSNQPVAKVTVARSTTVSVNVVGVQADHSAVLSVTLKQSDDPALAGRFVSVARIIDDRGLQKQEAMLTKPAASAPWGPASTEEARYYGNVHSIVDLSPEIVVLPDEQIGIGAIWTIRGGGNLLTTTCQLISRTGDRLVIESHTTDSFAPGRGPSAQTTGSKSDEIDLGLPVAVHTVEEFQIIAWSTVSPDSKVATSYTSTRETVP